MKRALSIFLFILSMFVVGPILTLGSIFQQLMFLFGAFHVWTNRLADLVLDFITKHFSQEIEGMMKLGQKIIEKNK